MECWEDITIEELRQLHAEQLADDANTPDWAIEDMKAHGGWEPTILFGGNIYNITCVDDVQFRHEKLKLTAHRERR